jgi:hypothetical protein
MNMDFRKQEEIITDYLKNNFEKYLQEFNLKAPEVVNDFLDFDKYKQSFIVFIDFDEVDFPQSGFNDSCSKTQRLAINFYLVFRNDAPANLQTKMLDATSAFCEMMWEFDARKFLSSRVNKIHFFKFIEGANNIMSSKFTVEFEVEVE